jgi:hypothetical protein
VNSAVAGVPSSTEARAKYLLLAHVIERVGEALKPLDAPAMLVKGAALAVTVYAKPWLRPMSDIDVLVKEHDRERVLAALSRRGFEVSPPPADRRVSAPLLGETSVWFVTGGTTILVEVHHRLDKIVRHPIDYEGVFARARPLASGLLVPDNTDHALLVILHAALSEFRHEVAWRDLELLLRAGVDADALQMRAAAWKLERASFLALAALRARGSSVPSALVDALTPTPLQRRSLELFYHIGEDPAPRAPLSLGVRWLVRQAPLVDDFGDWLSSVARYAASRVRDRADWLNKH